MIALLAALLVLLPFATAAVALERWERGLTWQVTANGGIYSSTTWQTTSDGVSAYPILTGGI